MEQVYCCTNYSEGFIINCPSAYTTCISSPSCNTANTWIDVCRFEFWFNMVISFSAAFMLFIFLIGLMVIIKTLTGGIESGIKKYKLNHPPPLIINVPCEQTSLIIPESTTQTDYVEQKI